MERHRTNRQISAVVLALFLALTAAGCKKKTPVAATPPPPPPAPVKTAPARPVIAQFEAEPATIERGQAATLRWAVTGETTKIEIAPGVGSIGAKGNRQVFPSSSTTYTLTATGPGGDAELTATVNVAAKQEPLPRESPKPRRSFLEFMNSEMKDIFFDYDRSDLREDARAQLTRNADNLKRALQSEFQNQTVIVEGHADERGSGEYNLGLSDRRAAAAIDFLVQLGIPRESLKPVTFGKERPQCTDSNETCWQMNRRAHFAAGQ